MWAVWVSYPGPLAFESDTLLAEEMGVKDILEQYQVNDIILGIIFYCFDILIFIHYAYLFIKWILYHFVHNFSA